MFVPYQSVATTPALAAGTIARQLVRAAARVAKQAMETSPEYVIPQHPLVNPSAQSIADLAEEIRNAPTPLLPFEKGQCCGTTYEVSIRYKTPGGMQVQTVAVTGQISAPKVEANSAGLLGTFVPYYACDGIERRINAWGNVSPSAILNGDYGFITILSVTPLFGSDNCGDPLPILPPTLPPPETLERREDIVFAPGIIIPIAFVYVRPTVEVNVNANANVNIPITIGAPQLDINFNFDAGGININFGNGGDRTYAPGTPDVRDPAPISKPTQPEGEDKNLRRIERRIIELEKDVEELKECACPPETVILTQQYPAANSRTIACPPRTILIRMTLEEFPVNSRKQFGGDAPDVLYAGWGAFQYGGGGQGERLPIDYAEKSFIPDRDPQGFAYTCYAGTTARITVYYEVDNPTP